jgi:hypothetical protein
MTHDPLCMNEWLVTEQCHCVLIAKVREDMLDKCIAAVQATITSAPTLGQKKAIAALQALQDTP